MIKMSERDIRSVLRATANDNAALFWQRQLDTVYWAAFDADDSALAEGGRGALLAALADRGLPEPSDGPSSLSDETIWLLFRMVPWDPAEHIRWRLDDDDVLRFYADCTSIFEPETDLPEDSVEITEDNADLLLSIYRRARACGQEFMFGSGLFAATVRGRAPGRSFLDLIAENTYWAPKFAAVAP